MRWLLPLCLVGCALEPGRGELEAEVRAVPVAAAQWVDEDAHEIVLTKAEITVRDLTFMEPPTETAAVLPVGPFPFWVASAVAHPGHDDAGPVGGELLGSFPIDLLQPPTSLGMAVLYEGVYEGAELAYDGPVVLEGTIDGQPFAFTVEPHQAVTAIDFDAELTAGDAPTLDLRIDIAWALSFVDWEAGDGDGDGRITEGDGDQETLLLFGLHSNQGFEVTVP